MFTINIWIRQKALPGLDLKERWKWSCSIVSDSYATPWTVDYQAPQSMEFSRQEYWSGLPFPLQGIFPTQGLNLGLPHYKQMLYHLSHQGSPRLGLEVKWSEVAQSYLTLCNPVDCSLPGSSIHGILQARILRNPYILSPVETLTWGWDGKWSLLEGDEVQGQTHLVCPVKQLFHPLKQKNKNRTWVEHQIWVWREEYGQCAGFQSQVTLVFGAHVEGEEIHR